MPVVRIRRIDGRKEWVLVQVESHANNALDLKLIGSEHEHLYHARIQERSLASLRSTSSSCTVDEWKAILERIFLNKKSPLDAVQGAESVASIDDEVLSITIRKNIGGITQKLGVVSLEQDDEREEVSIFQWVDEALADSYQNAELLDSARTTIAAQQVQVAELEKQLEDLIRLKKQHEDELLRKFAALLNTKKLKIRNQQRLLARATNNHVDEEKDISAGRPNGRRSAAPGKRKANDDTAFRRKAQAYQDSDVTDDEPDIAGQGTEDIDGQTSTDDGESVDNIAEIPENVHEDSPRAPAMSQRAEHNTATESSPRNMTLREKRAQASRAEAMVEQNATDEETDDEL